MDSGVGLWGRFFCIYEQLYHNQKLFQYEFKNCDILVINFDLVLVHLYTLNLLETHKKN